MDIEVEEDNASESEESMSSICEVAELEVEIEGPEYRDLEYKAQNDPRHPKIFIPSELGIKWSHKLETISSLFLKKYKTGNDCKY